jgi:hypothetical protein
MHADLLPDGEAFGDFLLENYQKEVVTVRQVLGGEHRGS